jgi:hypothetical protein
MQIVLLGCQCHKYDAEHQKHLHCDPNFESTCIKALYINKNVTAFRN